MHFWFSFDILITFKFSLRVYEKGLTVYFSTCYKIKKKYFKSVLKFMVFLKKTTLSFLKNYRKKITYFL